jgi:hypothetical protein
MMFPRFLIRAQCLLAARRRSQPRATAANSFIEFQP